MNEELPAHQPEMVIPADRLPPGFAEGIENAAVPAAEPRPAATAVLLRDGAQGAELLLLKRLGSAGFVPGAYVFPGGRVDAGDGDPELLALLQEPVTDPPAHYWLAAVREVFEETGVLLARHADGEWCADSTRDGAVAWWRERLLSHGATLFEVMEGLDACPDLSGMVYCAHWITPVAEPRRYDTRFFMAELPLGREVTADAREMCDAVWLTATTALERFRQGTLPMVFPTVKTVERLARYGTVAEAQAALRGLEVPAVLPRLVRTPDGVGIVVDG